MYILTTTKYVQSIYLIEIHTCMTRNLRSPKHKLAVDVRIYAFF